MLRKTLTPTDAAGGLRRVDGGARKNAASIQQESSSHNQSSESQHNDSVDMFVGEAEHFRMRPMLLLSRSTFVVGGSQPLLLKWPTPRHLPFARPNRWLRSAFLASRGRLT